MYFKKKSDIFKDKIKKTGKRTFTRRLERFQ